MNDSNMTRSEMVALVTDYLAALNRRDADAIAGFVTEDFVSEHTSARGQGLEGRAEYRARLEIFLASFPVIAYEIEDIVIDGPKAVVAYRMRAHYAGPDGASEPKPIDVRGVFRFELRDGHIARRVDYRDGITVEVQLGMRV